MGGTPLRPGPRPTWGICTNREADDLLDAPPCPDTNGRESEGSPWAAAARWGNALPFLLDDENAVSPGSDLTSPTEVHQLGFGATH